MSMRIGGNDEICGFNPVGPLGGVQGGDSAGQTQMLQLMLQLFSEMLRKITQMNEGTTASPAEGEEVGPSGGVESPARGGKAATGMEGMRLMFEELLQHMGAGTSGDGQPSGGDAGGGGRAKSPSAYAAEPNAGGTAHGAPAAGVKPAGPGTALASPADGGKPSAAPAAPKTSPEAAPTQAGADATGAPEAPAKRTDPQAASTGPADGATGPTAAQEVGATGKVGGSQTRDGYTVEDVKKDMLEIQANDPTQGPPPTEPKLTQIAQGIVDGVNENFSGKNGIGDYSDVSGQEMAQTLAAMAWKESRFDTNGQDAGDVLQCWHGRLDSYNEAHGTNISQADLAEDIPLAMKCSTWAMANPPGIVGVQAGDVPIPEGLADQAAYYWNYNPTTNHGHANELADYMSELERNRGGISGT